MSLTQDDFQHWLVDMDFRLEAFFKSLPRGVASKLNYSAESLPVIEKWLLKNYGSIKAIIKDSEKTRLDQAACYVGETFRKILGGHWTIDLKNKRNVYFAIPTIEKKDQFVECPVTLCTVAVDRRTGRTMTELVEALAGEFGTVKKARKKR